MRREIIINGQKFNDLDGFFDEIEHMMTKNLSWRIGRNLDAFNDVLRGGFGVHEYGEPIKIKWIHFEKSKSDLGYPATVLYYQEMLKHCHPLNINHVKKMLQDAESQFGSTLLEIIVQIIIDVNNSGHDCILETEE